MNGHTSPLPSDTPADVLPERTTIESTTSGTTSPGIVAQSHEQEATDARPALDIADGRGADEDIARVKAGNDVMMNGDHDDAASEAETLIDSPVKKREADKQKQLQTRSRIGGLPVPGEDDEESESVATPLQSTEISEGKVASGIDGKETGDEMDMGSDKEESSDPLSSAPSPASTALSLVSGRSRAMTEGLETAHNDAEIENPRKRKHRASSVGFPSKRQSMDPPKRNLRGIQSEDLAGQVDRSPSPKLRSHRRAASTQSALLDGTADNPRPRRGASQLPMRDPKSRNLRRAQRGVGRSTSTPGRPIGRELKRHVNKYGFTRLAEACDNGDLDLVKQWRERDPEQLEVAEYAQNTPLQIASLRGNAEIVQYLVDEGCHIDCANVDKDTPLIDASENGHLEVVKILLNAGVDPLGQNLKGQQALDVVKDDEDNADEIRVILRNAIEQWNSDGAKQRREEDEEARHQQKPNKEIHFMARTHENLIRLITINDRNGVREFLDARVPVDNAAIAAAARTGDQYLVNMLLAELSDKKANQKPEKPVLAVLGTSHFEMLKMLISLDQFNPTWISRGGKSWAEIAEERGGPHWRQEKDLFERLTVGKAKNMGIRRSSSPVTKRESSKRRLPPQLRDQDESDEEDGPKPKNGRRLMSRRAMRAASSKARSDSESEGESTSDTGTGHTVEANEPEPETSMQPPGSPSRRKASGRQRTKSISSVPTEVSPKARRRSSSFRGLQEHALPVLEETAEDRDAMEIDANEKAEAVLREAQAREEQQRKAAAEVEAKRAEEAVKAEERRKEEEAQKAEEERRADVERRLAEETRQREAEEMARKAEEQKKADEERRQSEAQLEGARRDFCRKLFDVLPRPMADLFDPDGSGKRITDAILTDICLPLHVVRDGNGTDQILNVQAGALLGKRGQELLFPRNSELGFTRTFSEQWQASTPGSSFTRRIAHGLAKQRVLDEMSSVDDDHETQDASDDFAAEVKRMHDRLDRVARYRDQIVDTLPLELVQLQDVLANLDPATRDLQLLVQYSQLSAQRSSMVRTKLDKQGIESFVGRIQGVWEAEPLMRQVKAGGEVEADAETWAGETVVTIVHEK
ncbi:hypothetical protein LTR86_010324 [Recurvomyces mirabilis]|nr:hypothetical protein LTR86_010324 [Recurvomyces mirabilis]